MPSTESVKADIRSGESSTTSSDSKVRTLEPLLAACRCAVGRLGLAEALDLIRQHMILEALRRCGGSKRAAAKLLAIDRAYLRRRLRQFIGGGGGQ